MRGLLLLYLGLWVFLGPSTEDVEHISATLLCIINLKQFASKALEGRGEIYHMTNLPKNNQLVLEINPISNAFVNGQFDVSIIGKALNNISGTRIDDLKLVDLIFFVCHCNGVYVFCDNDGVLKFPPQNVFNNVTAKNQVAYVGKASSRSFVERIAGHFAPRQWDYMNTLIKRIAEIVFGSITDKTICDSFSIASQLYLKLIVFDNCIDSNVIGSIDELEEDLINYFKPTLNKIPGCRSKIRR